VYLVFWRVRTASTRCSLVQTGAQLAPVFEFAATARRALLFRAGGHFGASWCGLIRVERGLYGTFFGTIRCSVFVPAWPPAPPFEPEFAVASAAPTLARDGGPGSVSMACDWSAKPICVKTPIVNRISEWRANAWAVRGITPSVPREHNIAPRGCGYLQCAVRHLDLDI